MKKIFRVIAIALWSMPIAVWAQPDVIRNFERFDIKNSSGQMLDLIAKNLEAQQKQPYLDLLQQKQKIILNSFNLSDSTVRAFYISDFSASLDKTRNAILNKEALFLVNEKLVKQLGVDGLTRNTGLQSSGYIGNYLTPAFRAGFAQYSQDKIKDIIGAMKPSDVNVLVKQTLICLKANGIVVTATTSVETIKQQIERVTGVFVRLDSADIRRELLNNLSASIQVAVRNGLNQGSIAVTGTVTRIKADLENKVSVTISAVNVSLNTQLNKLGGYISELTGNEKVVQETIQNIYNDWGAVDSLIKGSERRLSGMADGTDKARELLEHARLVAQNYIRLDIINKYINTGAEAIRAIDGFKKGLYAKVFDDQERAKFLNQLKSFDLPTITETIQSVGQVASFFSTVFPNSPAVKEVSKFVGYAMAAVKIAVGVAELYSGNPLGVVSILGGLGGLFGGPPQESPEMQMLKQMMDYMQKNFQAVFDHLEYIEKQLQNLTQMVQDMYRDMMKSFEVISQKIDVIQRRDQVLDDRTRLLLFANFNQCHQLERDRQAALASDNSFLSSYNDYSTLYNSSPDCKPCLTALYKFSISENLDLFVKRSVVNQFDQVDFEINDVYGPTRQLFLATNSENPAAAIVALSFPVKSLSSDANAIFSDIVLHPEKIDRADTSKVLADYYDYHMLGTLADLWVTYSPFIELAGNEFAPKSMADYLNTSDQELLIRKNGLTDRLRALLTIIDRSIAQQSLMAGNLMMEDTYQILIGFNPNLTNVDLAIKVLQNNSMFAKNFASRLIYSAINGKPNPDSSRYTLFSTLYYEAKSDPSKIQVLNQEFGNSNMQFAYVSQFNNIFLQLNVRGHNFQIPCPEPAFVVNHELAQMDAMYELLNAKEKVISKLVDLSFNRNYISAHGISINDLKFLYEVR